MLTPRDLVPQDHNRRWLAFGNLVSMMGSGASMATLVVFLSVVKNLTLATAASVLSVAGIVGILGAVPVGVLIDKAGPKNVAIVTEVVCFGAVVALVASPDISWLVVALLVRQLSVSANTVARATLMGRFGDAESRVALRAYQRAVTNVGFALGTIVSGVAVGLGTPTALVAVMALDAATFLVGAYATLRLRGAFAHEQLTADKAVGGRFEVVRDWRYLVLALINAAHSLSGVAAGVGISFWVVYSSNLPNWSVSLSYALGTLLVVVLQVRLSRQASTVVGSVASLRSAGLLAGLFCLLLATSGALHGWVMWVPFLIATCVIAISEILGAAGGWTLSYEFATDRALGRYQAVWQLSADGIVKGAGPLIFGAAVGYGAAGLIAVSVGFCVLALSTPSLVAGIGRAGPAGSAA